MNQIVEEARRWLGVRWLHQGRSQQGVDCVGLPIMVFQATKGSTLDFTGYARQASDEAMLEICAAHMQPVPLDLMAPGDVVVMRFDNQRHMAMLGDYPGGLSLIHAHARARRVVEHRMDEAWRSRIMGCFRWRDE
jgi:cell wall-associated NlpC family hydrolase